MQKIDCKIQIYPYIPSNILNLQPIVDIVLERRLLLPM